MKIEQFFQTHYRKYDQQNKKRNPFGSIFGMDQSIWLFAQYFDHKV